MNQATINELVQYYEKQQIEQQLKLYSESQQQKIDEAIQSRNESEQARNDLLDNSKLMLLEIKKDNQTLNEQAQKYKQEVEKLQQKLKSSELSDQENSSKLANYAVLQERVKILEKMNQENRRKENGNTNNTSITLNNTNIHHHPILPLYSDNTINKETKSNRQTPPLTMVQPSPLKNARKSRTPQLPNNNFNLSNTSNNNSNNKNSDYLKVRIDVMENIGNNLKEIKNLSNTQNLYPLSLPHQENQNGSGPTISKVKDLSTIYNIRSRSRNEPNKTLYSHHPSTNSSINNSFNNALIGVTNRDAQGSALGSHSQSAQQNKRSKSYGINKLRGSISKQVNGGGVNGSTNNNDGSRLSNISQEYSDYLNQDIQNRSTNENFANNCTYSSIYQQTNTIQQQQQQQYQQQNTKI